ncbi:MULTISPECIES: hypothetical protein [unclassified Yoonia]|uniref:hypothetical protein n=1 Tax=unclassified Yoonia TaxID=2629118 RepID=UPI002AFDD65D|nr:MULTISPECIES: hypothetical protein [unclassified Yoonia]
MPQENQSQLFIRLLKDARSADRAITKIRRSARSRAYAKRFKEMFMSDQPLGRNAAMPMDCVQMIDSKAGHSTRN